MQAVSADGQIDAKTKQLMTFALIILGRCEECFEVHYKKSREMGITQEQLDEAAWLGVGVGGAVVRMFYVAQMKKVGGDSNGCCC